MIAPFAVSKKNKPVMGLDFRFEYLDVVDVSLRHFQGRSFYVIGPVNYHQAWPTGLEFVIRETLEGQQFMATAREVGGIVT